MTHHLLSHLIVLLLLSGGVFLDAKAEEESESARWMSEALEWIAADQPDKAVSLLQDLERKYPRSSEAPEALLRLGYLLAEKDVVQSRREFQNLIERYPDSSQCVEALYHLGYVYFQAGEIDDASACYAELIERAPNRHVDSARIMRAKCAIEQGRPQDALLDLTKAAVEGVATGKHFEAQRLLAETWLESRDSLGVLSPEVQAALPDALYLASDVYLNKREKPAEAAVFLTELVEGYPNYSKRSGALFWLGAAYIRTNRREEAARVYEEIIEKYPDRDHAIGAQQELVRLAHDADDYEEVLRRAEKLYSYNHIRARLYAILTCWRASRKLGIESTRPLEMVEEFLKTPNLEAKWADEARSIRETILKTEELIASSTAEGNPIQLPLDADVKLTGWKLGIQKAILDDELEKGNVEAALALARQLIEQYPEGPDREQIKWHAAKIYARLNRFEEAYQLLGKDFHHSE